MRIKYLVGGLAVSVLSLVSAMSEAAVTQLVLKTTAQHCRVIDVSSTAGEPASFMVNEFGVINGSATVALGVVCPVTVHKLGTLQALRVHVWDRSAANPVTCNLFRVNDSGSLTLIDSKSSTSHSGAVKPIGFSNLVQTNGGEALSVTCSIPQTDAAAGSGTFSGVRSIELEYQAQ
jgi:hypothetical protein